MFSFPSALSLVLQSTTALKGEKQSPMDPSERKKGYMPVLWRAAFPDSKQKTGLGLCVGGKEVRREQRALNLRVASHGLMPVGNSLPTALHVFEFQEQRAGGLGNLCGHCGTLGSQLAILIQGSVFNLFLFIAPV